MSPRVINVFCQVGFSTKEWGPDPYFHKIDGKDYRARLQIPDGVEYLSPYTPEDLVTGNISIEELPEGLKAAIGQVIERTILAIERVNPGQITEAEIVAIAVKFQLSQIGGESEGTSEGEDMGRYLN